MQSSQAQAHPLRTMVARVSADDIVIYANSALAVYLGARKRDVIGAPLEVVAKRCQGEIAGCFTRPDTGRSSNHLVTDAAGRVFEAKIYSDGGVLDIVLDEVTDADSIGRELLDASGTAFESLSEDELRTTRHPERRYLTVTYTHLLGVPQLTERLAPMEARLMVNSFVEEACDAIFENGSTVGETWGDSILGIFGAPRYHADHPVRAIVAACDQMRKVAQLHTGFHREGKELPPSSCGIWTGDVLVGTLGNSAWQHYTALGLSVDLARKLGELARPGEILLPEHTLTHMLRVLPEGWEHIRAESEFEPDLSDFQWSGDDVAPLPEHLTKVVYLVGRGVQNNAEQVELFFNYLWQLKIPGRDQYVPILRVTRPMEVGDGIELSDDNVVTTQIAQTLGKYKLISVIGSGGMGKVWRGVDRFGNAVAIKVLHSGETVTEAALKRFRREAEIMARLPHRNICRVFEMNEFDGIQYLAMEFVDGLTLSDLLYEKIEAETTNGTGKVDLRSLIHSIRSSRTLREQSVAEEEAEPASGSRPKLSRILPVEQTLSIILKVCDAVQFAHEHGVLHRDLKPGNILLREDGEPLVADFGLAKLNSADATQSLSMTGHVVGTLENMSPEQAESSKTVDERADVYSLGTILYQMLTGRRHFEATGNIVVDAQALRTHEPVRPRALNGHIDLDLEIITLKALRNDPVERYRNVSALQADIERYRRGEVISARPVSPAELLRKMVQRNRTTSAVIATSGLILVVGTVVALYFLTKGNMDLRAANAEAKKQTEEAQRLAEAANLAKAEAQTQAESAKKAQEEAVGSAKLAEAARVLAEEKTQAASEALAERDSARKKGEEADAAKATALKQAEEAERQKEVAQSKLENAKREAMNEARKLGPRLLAQQRPDQIGSMGPTHEAQEAYAKALQIFNLGMLQSGLADSAVNQLSEALDENSKALTLDPDFLPALLLQGRLHLCLLEFTQARDYFARAAQLAATAPPLPNGDKPGDLLQLMNDVANVPGDKTPKILEKLREAPQDSPNGIAAQILKLVSNKARRNSLATSPMNPLGRAVSPGEITQALVEKNGPFTQVFVQSGTDKKPMVIVWNNEQLNDLSPLKLLDPAGVAIIGAKSVDWNTLKSLDKLAALDLSKCELGNTFPGGFPSPFARLRSLKLADSDVSNLDFLRGMLLLDSLDLSGTNVTDLLPLAACRLLQDLNVANLNPANLGVLLRLPLQSLVLSPLLITDKASLNALRAQRLKILRTPTDPVTQTASEFWRNLDSGTYNSAN